MKPGKALDVGMGQGRNALYLAGIGWDVTGIDIADEGIRIAEEAARRDGLKLKAFVADATKWDWGTDRWDMICLIYMGGQQWMPYVKRALKPGGIVVVEYFHADAMKGRGIGGLQKGELPKLLGDGFEVVREDEVEDVADYTLQKLKLIRLVARKK
jgi:SAM-dependent methyltransferase